MAKKFKNAFEERKAKGLVYDSRNKQSEVKSSENEYDNEFERRKRQGLVYDSRIEKAKKEAVKNAEYERAIRPKRNDYNTDRLREVSKPERPYGGMIQSEESFNKDLPLYAKIYNKTQSTISNVKNEQKRIDAQIDNDVSYFRNAVTNYFKNKPEEVARNTQQKRIPYADTIKETNTRTNYNTDRLSDIAKKYNQNNGSISSPDSLPENNYFSSEPQPRWINARNDFVRNVKDAVTGFAVGSADFITKPIDKLLSPITDNVFPSAWKNKSGYEKRIIEELNNNPEIAKSDIPKIAYNMVREKEKNDFFMEALDKTQDYDYKSGGIVNSSANLGRTASFMATAGLTKNPFIGGFLGGVIDAYGNGGSAEDVLKSGVTSGLFMLAGGKTSKLARGGVDKLIGSSTLKNTVTGHVIKSVAGGLGFGLGGTASQVPMGLVDENYMPTGEDLAHNMLLGVLFETVPATISAINNIKYNKGVILKGMDDYSNEMKRNLKEVMGEKNPELKFDKYNEMLNRNQGIISIFEKGEFVGAKNEVARAKLSLEMISDLLRKERSRLPQDMINGTVPPKTASQGQMPRLPSMQQEGNAVQPQMPQTNVPNIRDIYEQYLGDKYKLPNTMPQLPQPQTTQIEPQTTQLPNVNPQTTQIQPQVQPNVQKVSMDDRFISEVGNKKINAYQYDNPEIKPIFQDIAQYVLNLELLKAKKGWNGDLEREMQGEVMKKLKATGLSYDEIERGLKLIVEDEGAENVASAKKVEIVLDELLTQGFKGINGEVWDSNIPYLEIKSRVEGKTYEPQTNTFDVEGLPDGNYAQPVEQSPPSVIKPQQTVIKPQQNVTKPQESVIKPSESNVKSDAKIGQPFKSVMYNGKGKTRDEIYNYVKYPILGDGKYYAFTEEYAKNYGEDVTSKDVSLENPFVINDDGDWRNLTRASGWEYPNPYGGDPNKIKSQIDKLKEIVLSKKYDGIIVKFEDYIDGDINSVTNNSIKLLRNIFGHDQVVVYNEPKEQVIKQDIQVEHAEKQPSPQSKLAYKVENMIGSKFSNAVLFELAEEAYGGTQAEGKFTVKDAHDGLELGFNTYLLDRYTRMPIKNMELFQIKNQLTFIQNLLNGLPTQGRNRTDEMIKYQQFSTPPNISIIANWLANTGTKDVVLEPSAGIGGLALFAKGNGATVYVNELSKRRLEFIKELPFDGFFNENAEQIDNVLPDNIKPTVIIMNPPFSATAGRMGDKKNSTQNATRHIEQALSRLEEGGRLVAIVGNGMAHDKPAFKKWWEEIESKYNVRANITIDGINYEKYGTTFDINMFVIDKTGETTEPVKTGVYTELEDVLTDLEGIKDERSRITDNKYKQKTDINTGKKTTEKPEGNKPIPNPSDSGGIAKPTKPNDNPEKTPTRIDGQVGESKPKDATTSTNTDTRPSDGGTKPRTTDNTVSEVGETTKPTKRDGDGVDRQPSGKLSDGINKGIKASNKKNDVDKIIEHEDDVYSKYKPSKLVIEGAKPHITDLVESGAMSAVSPPDVTYTPNLPKELITSGALSIAQLENIVYSGQSHQQKLPDGKRKGYFIGDGTGVGKGRQLAGIILDSFRNGRKKAVWISNNPKLIEDAKRDWTSLKQDTKEIKDIRKYKLDSKITDKEGIVFISYSTLKSNAKNNALKSRINQIIEWFGKDYDGVIIFDESHNMGNATDSGKGRKKTKASKQALAGIDLQNQLPNARIVYASATGATKVENLAYLTRLGLWGEGTSFITVENFIDKISKGGLSAMELVARDMKSLGVYLARSLSFKGVEYETIQHTLTPIQTEIYDTISRGWQEILKNVDEVLKDTNANGNAKGSAKSQFYSSMQRFYNQIITSMAMPSIVKDIKKQLADGNSVVIQLVNTNQASTDRQLVDKDIEELEDLDLTPTDIIVNYLDKSFPIYQYEVYVDENGNEQTKISLDSNGQPIINRKALAKKNQLIERIKEMKVPDGALEILFDEFGAEMVAEVTGRQQRVVAKKNSKGQLKRVLEKRNEKSNLADAQSFQNGDKKILVFSDAGGTGASYHADREAKNQTKRIHYLLQPGWNAFKATQGFGRTHRSGQVQPPLFKLVTTNIMGQKRFTSTIAKRLDQLGALTKGQRQTGSGVFGAKDNLESEIGEMALREFYKKTDVETIKKLGLGDKLLDKYGRYEEDFSIVTNIGMFLNRILSLEVDHQNETFDFFYSIFEDVYDKAFENGTLDMGLENYIAEKIEVVEEKVINTDKNSGAETTYIQLKAYQKPIILTYEAIEMHKEKFQGLVKINDTGEVRALYKGRNKTNSKGEIVPTYYLTATNPLKQSNYQQSTLDETTTKIPKKDWEKVWTESIKELPEFTEETLHMLSGTLLPIWNKLPESNAKVKRIMADDGSQYLGRIINANEIDTVLRKFNLDRVKETFESKDVMKRILENGEQARLEENKTKLSRRRVSGENRIEITGQNTWQYGRIEGVYEEIIASSRRYFIPTGADGIPVLERILKNNPIVEMTKDYKDSNEDVLSFSHPNSGAKGYPSSNGEGNLKDAITPTEMVQKFADRFEDVFIRKGRPNSREALADFNTRTYVTRLRKANDIPSLTHEMAHYLDVKFKIIIQMSPTKMMELASDFTDTQSDKMNLNVKASESFAEVIRSYLVGEIDYYNNHYQKFIVKNLDKKDLDFLDEMREDITNFINLKASDRVRKTVYAEGDKRPKKKFDFMEKLERAFTGFVDEHRPVVRTARELGGKQGEQQIKDYLAQLRGYKATASFNINPSGAKGYYQSNLKGENVGKSLYDIVKPLVDAGYEFEDSFWRVYAVARRAMDYKERKLEMPLPYKDYEDTIIELEQKYPEFKDIFEDIQLFKKNLMQLLVDSGLKTQKQIDDIIELNPNHMHLFRVMEDSGGTGSGKLGNAKNPINRLRGSGLDIVDPYESLIKMTYLYWNIARRQETMTKLADLESKAVGKGIWLSKADIKIVPKKLKTDEVATVVKAYFTQIFDQVGQITEPELDALKNDVDASKTELGSLAQTLFEISHRAKENQVVIHIKGKPVVYDINPELYKAIVEHDPIVTNTITKMLVGIGNFQATTIMATPKFPIYTAIREIGTDLLMTRTGMTPLDILKAYIDVMGGNAVWREFEKRGGTNEVYFAKDGIFEKKVIKQIRANKSKLDKLKHKSRHPIDSTMDVLKILDVSPKLAEYTKGLENDGYFKRGLAEVIKEAYVNRTDKKISSEYLLNQAVLKNTPEYVHRNNVWKARDISYDLSKTGSTMRKYQINSIWRFSKANIQGTTNLGKVVYDKDVRKNFLIRGVMMVMMTVGLYALLRENEYYQDMQDYLKDGYWWVPVGDPKTTKDFIAIPKPFQEALLFSTVTERTLRSMEDDPYISKRAFDNLMNTTMSTFFPETMPMALSPLMENAMNEQWNGVPIENMSEILYKRPEDRYNEYTSQVAINIAKLTKHIPFMPESLRSPKKIDNLLIGYTNAWGKSALTGIDAMAGTKQPKDLLTTSGITNLGVRDVSKFSKSINEFYNDRGKLMQELNALKQDILEGKDVTLPKIDSYTLNKDLLKQYDDTSKELDMLRDAKKEFVKNKNKAGEDYIQAEMVRLAKNINKLSDLLGQKK